MCPASASDSFTGNRLRDLQQLRATTLDLISECGCMVSLVRGSGTVSDGAGGRVPSSTASSTQTAVQRFFAPLSYEPQEYNDSIQGEKLHVRFVLVGRWDDDIQEGDYFWFGNKKYIIDKVLPDRSYETRAEGEVPSDGQ